MKNLKLVLSIIAFGLLFSCVNSTFDEPKSADCLPLGLSKNKEVTDLYAIATNPTVTPPSVIPNTAVYTADDRIEAIVISSDEGGNFYQKMYLQPTDGSKGFILSVDNGNVYTKGFQPGRKIILKMKGLAFANPTSFDRGLYIGAPPTDKYTVDRITTSAIANYLLPTCEVLDEETYVQKNLTLAQVQNDIYLNRLVEIDNVQFKTDCATYSKPDFDTSLKLSSGATTLDLRTSRFAGFSGKYVPSGNGKIRGVLAKYNNGYQLIIRTERDVKFTNPRIQTVVAPKVGTNLTYTGAFTENFESYATTTTGTLFPKYINDPAIGYKFWDVVSFSGNKYIQVSAFNNGCTKAYFVVPVDLTAANGLSFKTKDGYNDGNPLKVYYTTNYTPGSNMNLATLVDITNKINISTGNTTGYGTAFINSGTYSIPSSVTGNGFFVFEYDGTNGITTTMQIDDIVVN